MSERVLVVCPDCDGTGMIRMSTDGLQYVCRSCNASGGRRVEIPEESRRVVAREWWAERNPAAQNVPMANEMVAQLEANPSVPVTIKVERRDDGTLNLVCTASVLAPTPAAGASHE